MRRERRYVTATAFWVMGMAAPLRAQCGLPSETTPDVRDSMLVTAEWLAPRLNDPRIVVLYVGDPAGYDAGHIPGARLVDAHGFTSGHHDLPPAARIDSLLEELGVSNGSRVILYGDAWMTGWIYLALDYVGHGDRTAILDGGLAEWRAGNRAISTQPARVRRATFTPSVRRDIVVDAAWVRERLGETSVPIVDTRTSEEYAGTAREDLPRRGHISGATLLEWDRTFSRPDAAREHGQTSRLLPVRELRALLGQAGVQPGRVPVFYCTVGMRASHVYFVARYLGYDPKFYDGSMSDWSRRSELPVTTGTARGSAR